MAVRHAAEPGLDCAVTVEHEGCRGLQHVEVARDIGAMSEVDIQVKNPGTRGGDFAERPVNAGSSAAHLRAELQQGCSVPEPVGTETGRLDDLMVDITPQAPLSAAQQDADHGGDRDQSGDAEKSREGFHGIPH